MNVPLLDLRPQLESLRPQLLEAMTRVLDSTGYILGPEVERFEEAAAAYCGTEHAVGLSSGTDALLAALMALDIGPGDRVLTTPYSFFATMGVVLRVGAVPVFVDIDPESFDMDAGQAAERLAEDAKKGKTIKAILPVHLYGQCADMPRLRALAEEYGIPLIEAAAQAIGAECPFPRADGTVEWKRAGAMGLGGCFSFFPSKNLGGLGDGGMLVTNDADYAATVRSVRNHGEEGRYYHRRVGGNFRLDALQAALLAVKLPHLESWHRGRAENAATYRKLFAEAGLAGEPLRLPKAVFADAPGAEAHNHHIYNQFVIRTRNREERDGLRRHLLDRGIGCAVYYPLCLHQQQCLPEAAKGQGPFPVAEEAAATSLALPVFPELSRAPLASVVDTIGDFYHKRS